MAKKNLSYDAAVAEIERILERFRSERMSVDDLAQEVERATTLIAQCKERLVKAEEDVARVMEKDNAAEQ